MMPRPIPILALCLLAACGGTDTRYLVEPAAGPAPVRLKVASIEVRDMVLPAYAEAPEILQEQADGGLRPLKDAVWAEDTAQALTAQLVASLGLRSTADVAAEPWPLVDYPDARLDVRVARLVARADGAFEMTGQYAVASPDGRIADLLDRFEIRVPVEGEGPAAIARAKGRALDALADRIVARLRR